MLHVEHDPHKNRNMQPCDPLCPVQRSNVIREGDSFVLQLSDGKRVFGRALPYSLAKKGVRIYKTSYRTHKLIGIEYGRVVAQGSNDLKVLAPSEGLQRNVPEALAAVEQKDGDNRHLVDTNANQAMSQAEVKRLQREDDSNIVGRIIEGSSTYSRKSTFSRQKYVARKLAKHEPRARILKANAANVCETLYMRDAKKIMNMRSDTLGQILAYANLAAGSQALLWEENGLLTAAVAERLAGYGVVYSVYTGQQHSYQDMVERLNLSTPEILSIRWVHSSDALSQGGDEAKEQDLEKIDREALQWPTPLQSHTRGWLEKMESREDQEKFLKRRSARFARKLTRPSALEVRDSLDARQSDCLIVAVRSHNPKDILLSLMPRLASSCPFVVFCEYMEPLTECFAVLQERNIAINLRLSDTWAREYQILPERTHPSMTMSQSGGFLLTGVKVDPVTGVSELDPSLIKEIREQIGGRRGRKRKTTAPDQTNGGEEKRGKNE